MKVRTARLLLTLALCILLGPPSASAQQANKVPRIGVLWGGPAEFAKPYVEAGGRVLGELGYVEGRDFIVEYRFGERRVVSSSTLKNSTQVQRDEKETGSCWSGALRARGMGDASMRGTQEARTRMKALTVPPFSTYSKRALLALLVCATGCVSATSDSDPSTDVVSQAVSDQNRDRWEGKHCNDDDIESISRSDYLLPFTSNLPSPNNQGQAYIDIRVVKPNYKKNADAPAYGSQCSPKGVVVAMHGRFVDGVSGFDVQFKDYSLVEVWAKRGITTYIFNLLGTGLSSRFSMDNPCNTTTADQNNFLIPNPLSAPCSPTDPYIFTHTNAMVAQMGAVVDHAMSETGVEKVSLFAWSRGGFVVGPFAERFPAKVKNMIFYNANYTFRTVGAAAVPDNPPPLPAAGVPGGVSNRAAGLDDSWGAQLSAACPGQREAGVTDAIWASLNQRDPLGATWGSSGLVRFQNVSLYGWNKKNAVHVTTPILILSGQLDQSVLPAWEQLLYNEVASTKKVMVKIACASHYALWESSTLWGGPHTIVQSATADWVIGESFHGASAGIFNVSATGVITP